MAVERSLGERSGHGQTRTGPDGRYTIDGLLTGTYVLSAGGPEQPWRDDEVVSHGKAVTAEVEVAEGETVEVDLQLEAAAELTGVVLAADGTAVPGAYVYVWNADGVRVNPGNHQRTDEVGRFRVRGLPAGDLSVCAASGYDVSRIRAGVSVRGGSTNELELRLEPGTLLDVRTLDARGEPLGARLRVVDGRGYDFSSFLTTHRFGSPRSSTRTKIGPVPIGRYLVNAGFVGGAVASRSVEAGGEPVLDVELRAD